jgi:hypothetical protein
MPAQAGIHTLSGSVARYRLDPGLRRGDNQEPRDPARLDPRVRGGDDPGDPEPGLSPSAAE